ncbi:MAG: phosphoribosyltransferase family protein [Carnobacterium sp.]|uniref:ComF family protein n=1 Tax=Carnobacterium sp. TaxID=48221 RepID=UPI002FCB96A5
MINCLWCGKKETEKLRLGDLILFKKIESTVCCQECRQKLVKLAGRSVCPGCCREWLEAGLCSDCLRWQADYPDYVFKQIALYQYNAFLKEWIEAFKYKGDHRLAQLFKQEVREYFNQPVHKNKICIPIPISQTSLELRGFNQVEAILQAAGIAYLPVLHHIGTGKKQSSKDRKGRMLSPQPFQLDERYREQLKDRDVILVDDVYTTGRTLFHAAELLRTTELKTIETFTIAR